AFRNSCNRTLAHELRKTKGTSKVIVPVPLGDLSFPKARAATDAGNVKSAALVSLVEVGTMNAEVAYDLYEEPSRWSRVVLVFSIIAVVVFALLVVVPPVLSRLLPTSAPPHHKEMAAPPPAQTIVAITKSARTVSADPAGIAPPVVASTPTAPIAPDPQSSRATTPVPAVPAANAQEPVVAAQPARSA